MTSKEVLNMIDRDFDKIQVAMLCEFGNEGADIGDAGNAAELLGNQLEPHKEHTHEEFLKALSVVAAIPLTHITSTFNEMKTWTSQQWAEASAWEGFNDANL